jgi:DNA-binding protein HU-beta
LNKAELVASIAGEADLSKTKAEHALNAALEAIKKAVTKGDNVTVNRFWHIQFW